MALSAPLLSAAATPSSVNPGISKSSIAINVTGLRSTKGKVHFCVTANAKAFPDCSKDSQAVKLTVLAKTASAVTIPVAGPGTYAVSLIHDENGNGKLDTTLGMPREGFGFSRNPAIGFGPPKFKSAAFAVQGTAAQSVKMKYML